MAERREMKPNLVGPAGIDLQFQQAEFSILRIQPSLHRVMGNGCTSTRPPRSHASAPRPVTADAAADRRPVLLQPALYQREVPFLDLPPDELAGQPAMRFVALGHHNQTASGFVQAMHDPGTQLAAERR